MEEIIKPRERAISACHRKSDMVFVLGYENEKVTCVLESQDDDSECGCVYPWEVEVKALRSC